MWFRRREKSPFERYIDRAIWDKKIRSWTYPETWLIWVAAGVCGFLVGSWRPYGFWVGVGAIFVAQVASTWLSKRRLGATNEMDFLKKQNVNNAPFTIRRMFRDGDFAIRVGEPGVTIVNSCASAFQRYENAWLAQMRANEGDFRASAPFRPLSEGQNALMWAVMEKIVRRTTFKRPLDESDISALREIESSLNQISDEAERLAKVRTPESALPAAAIAALDAIKARREIEGP